MLSVETVYWLQIVLRQFLCVGLGHEHCCSARAKRTSRFGEKFANFNKLYNVNTVNVKYSVHKYSKCTPLKIFNNYATVLTFRTFWAVMWSETVGLRTRPVWDRKIGIGLGLGLAGFVLCCEPVKQSCHARRHNDLGGHSSFSSTVSSFSILCLEHHYCGDQQCRSLT